MEREKLNNFRTMTVQRTIYFLIIVLLFSLGSREAKGFPFRKLALGDQVPDASFVNYQGELEKTIHSFSGTPLLLAMWGGDLEAKRERAIKSLLVVKKLRPYLQENGIELLVINMQSDSPAVVEEVKSESGLNIPVYKDGKGAYARYGIYVLPSFLLINASGKVSGGLGYSRDLAQRLKGEIDIMLGLIDRKAFESNITTEITEISKEQKTAIRHFNMGISLRNKGMTEGAIREFNKALELSPNFNEARIELGCLYNEKNDLEAALKELEAVLENDDESIKAEICLASVRAKKGEVEEAISDLRSLLFRNNLNPDLHFVLGTLYEIQGHTKNSSFEFRKAFELLKNQEN